MTAPPDHGPGRTAALGLLAMLVMQPVAMPVPVLKELVADRFAVGDFLTSLFMSVNMVGAVLAAPLAGVLADRFGERRRLIVLALITDAALLWSLGRDLPFGGFLVLRFFEGGAHIFALSLLLAYAADGATLRRGRVMGFVGSGMMLGVALGMPVGGMVGATDPLRPLWVGSLVLLAAAVLAAAVVRDGGQRTRVPSMLAMVGAVLGNRELAVPLAYAFTDRFTVGFFVTIFPLMARNEHGFDRPTTGMLMAAMLLPFALMSYPCGRLADRVGRTVLVAGGSALYGAGVLVLGWWPPDGLWFLLPVLGVLSAVMFVPSLVLTVDLTPYGARATTMAAFNAAGSLGFIFGPLVGGAVSQTVSASSGPAAGYATAFAVAGLSELACVALTLPTLLRLRHQTRTT